MKKERWILLAGLLSAAALAALALALWIEPAGDWEEEEEDWEDGEAWDID